MWPDNESVGLSVCGVLGKSIYFMTPAANLTITVVLCFALSYSAQSMAWVYMLGKHLEISHFTLYFIPIDKVSFRSDDSGLP